VIGVLHGNKNTLTGIIDVAMVGQCTAEENLMNGLILTEW